MKQEFAEELERRDQRPTQLAHIVLRTARYAEMRKFYITLLNATIGFENSFACFLQYDEEHHRVVVAEVPGIKDRDQSTSGMEHFAFTYPTLGALLGNYRRLKEANIHPAWCINHGFTTSIYYNDPDGNLIETEYDNMTPAQAQEFMNSEYFARNPIGVDFDPEKLIENALAGVPVSELSRMGSAPLKDGLTPPRPKQIPDYDWRGELLPA